MGTAAEAKYCQFKERPFIGNGHQGRGRQKSDAPRTRLLAGRLPIRPGIELGPSHTGRQSDGGDRS